MPFDYADALTRAQSAQLALVTACGETLLRGAELLARIGLETARGALTEAATFVNTLPGARTPADIVSLQRDFSQSVTESAATAARTAYDILLDTQTALIRLITSHIAGFQATVTQATGTHAADTARKSTQSV
jgi:phasin family protein